MSIHGVCDKCGFIFLLEFGLRCPACVMVERTENVTKAFAPVDTIRTALGIEGLREDDELPGVYHWGESSYVEEDVIPKQVRMPKHEDDQVWELRRLFRL